ncbi:hypothetical protein ACFORG_19835 [Lutimaribacter marinistellae]|uniref:Uncharacterized protein n=1 Tax=Lutimaribacter marinistellae TaxID=1820329 RepID=A0ABV7TMK4_9RHOB
MDRKPADTHAVCLVLHPNPIIAADLSEILIEGGIPANQTSIATSIDIPTGAPVRLVIVDARLYRQAEHGLWDAMMRMGTHLLVLEDMSARDLPVAPNMRTLEQPFRTDEVLKTLRDMGTI